MSTIHEIRYKTMYEILYRQRTIFLDTFMILMGAVFMAAMANLQIPLWPVPITMQTFGVFAVAFFFGSRKGLISIAAYVAAGILGFGVFAGYSSGIKAILGATGGYIIGFLFMAFFVGWMIEKGYGRTRKSILLCMLAGELILYAFGLIGLYVWLGEKATILATLRYGFFPFIIGDTLKAFMAAALFPYLWQGAEKLGKR